MNTEPYSSDNAQPINKADSGAIVRTVPAPTLEELLAGSEPFLFKYEWDHQNGCPRLAWQTCFGHWETMGGFLRVTEISHYAPMPLMIAVERKG